MTPDYAEIVKALSRCTFIAGWEFQLVSDLNAARYNERARPLTGVQQRTLRQLAQKHRRQLPAEITALAAKLEPKGP